MPDGDVMTLDKRGDEHVIRVANFELMSSRQHGSEERLAELAVAAAGDLAGKRVLVGGLGMGFTLRAVLDLLPDSARVVVAELVPKVVDWNRTYLGELAGNPLSDSRVSVQIADIADVLKAATAAYDVILLDTDNGPEGTTQEGNAWLYGAGGLNAIHGALGPSGVLAVWSVFPSDAFTKRLNKAGFEADVKYVRSRGSKGNRHVIWLARKAAGRRRA